MPNLLDDAIQVANYAYMGRPEPSPSEMKRATQLVQRVITGKATNTDRVALRGILGRLGTSEQQVIAALQEESIG
jgi:hypothetical protein